MRLLLSGAKVPPLYSIQDRTIRHYQLRESRLETHKTKLLASIAIGAAAHIDDPNKKREWVNSINDLLKSCIALEFGDIENRPNEKEESMKELYEGYLKHLKPTITKDESGQLVVRGLESLLGPPGK